MSMRKVQRCNTNVQANEDGYLVQETRYFSKEEFEKYGICTAVKEVFCPFHDRQVASRTIYEDCHNVNPFLASAFPAIYIVFTLSGLATMIFVVVVAFVALLFLILNLALKKPVFPDGYPLTKPWLITTVGVYFCTVYISSWIANRYL